MFVNPAAAAAAAGSKPGPSSRTSNTNAPSLARFYAGLIGGVDGGPSEGLLSPEQIDRARTLQTAGSDQVLSLPEFEIESTIALGFWSCSAFAPFGGRHAFGHSGAGGSVGVADPEHDVAGGYVMNKMNANIEGDPRVGALTAAVQSCL